MNILLSCCLNLMNSIKDEEGQDLIEYMLILGVIAVVSGVTLASLGGNIAGLMVAVSRLVADAIGGV